MKLKKKLRVLREIYASMPIVECKGLCHGACEGIPVLPIELANLEQALGRELPVTMYREAVIMPDVNERCPLLVFGRCTAYEHRPIICRAFGVAAGLPCPFGCQPLRHLSDADQMAKVAKIEALQCQ